MLRRPLTRLTTAVAVAGAVCALGASAAVAAPHAVWSPPSKPIPGALTNNSPALGSISFPSPERQGVIAVWRGRGNAGKIFYKTRLTNSGGGWSHIATVPGALTSATPGVAGYTDPLGRHAVLLVWAGHQNKHIWYATAETNKAGTLDWTAPAILNSHINYSTTFAGPTVFFPDHSNVAFLVWRAPFNHVRYSIGSPAGRGIGWSQSAVVPGNPPSPTSAHCTIAPCTSATPVVTEATTSTSTGLIYVFWKQLGTKDIFYSTTPDSSATNWSHLTWTGPAQVPGAVTLTAPAASLPTVNGVGPLLLVYKAPFSSHVRYQTLSGATWSAPAPVPGTLTNEAPALLRNLLGTTTTGSIGNIVLRLYTG